MFLIRSLKEDDARRLEQYLKGDKNVTLGYEHSDYIPSAESENRIFSSPAEKVVYEKNIESLKEVGSYFFHSKDDLVGLRNASNELFFSPSSEEGLEAINRGKAVAKDYTGCNYVSTLIMEVDDELMKPFIDEGLAELREGLYGSDYNKETYSELVLGDKAFKTLLDKGSVLAYGECHKVFNGELFKDEAPFDPKHIFDSSYKPEIAIKPKKEELQDDGFKEEQKKQVNDWFASLSPEDREAFKDLENFDGFSSDEGALDKPIHSFEDDTDSLDRF